jgi:protein SCO1/2
VTLIAMFYGSCLTACPRLMHDVSVLVAAVPTADIRVLLVSFDAARDTPARLAELGTQHGFDPDRYRLAALPEPDARTLAAVLGVKYRKLDDGEFFHNSIITALDRDGVPFARVDGFVDLEPMIASLEHAR